MIVSGPTETGISQLIDKIYRCMIHLETLPDGSVSLNFDLGSIYFSILCRISSNDFFSLFFS